jgi:hypothetical protein
LPDTKDTEAVARSEDGPGVEQLRQRQLERRKTGQVEERKRGQRLFGGILGTLSKNKSSTPDTRRADIERKQMEKLRTQTEVVNAEREKELKVVTEVRRKQQRPYEQQVVSLPRNGSYG